MATRIAIIVAEPVENSSSWFRDPHLPTAPSRVYLTNATDEYTELLDPGVVAGISPLDNTDATWIMIFFVDIDPVNCTFRMRIPCHFTIVYLALLPLPLTVEKIGMTRG